MTDEFAAAARALSKGEPPEWVMPKIVHYSRLIGYRKTTKDDETDLETDNRGALAAAKYLEEQLQIHVLASYMVAEEEHDLIIPDCVETVFGELPELIEYLESQLQPSRKGGPVPITAATSALAYAHGCGVASMTRCSRSVLSFGRLAKRIGRLVAILKQALRAT